MESPNARAEAAGMSGTSRWADAAADAAGEAPRPIASTAAIRTARRRTCQMASVRSPPRLERLVASGRTCVQDDGPVVSRRPRLMLAALVALLVVLAVSLAIETGHESGGPPLGAPELRTRTLPAGAFVNSIGVSVHFPYTDTAYARQAEIIA